MKDFNLSEKIEKAKLNQNITNDINNSNVKHFREGREEGLKEGKEEGLKEGKEVGAKEKTMEIARNLKAAGVNIAVIQTTTGLGEEEIERL